MSAKNDVKVNVPDAATDAPHYGRLGIIVAVCFVIGALWPRVAGITLVPRVPTDDDGAKAATSASAAASASAAKPVATPPPAPEPEKTVAADESVKLDKTLVVSCRDDKGRKVAKCDEPDVTELTLPKIHALVGCDATQDAEGTLSLGIDFDFENGVIREISSGKSTTIKKPVAERLLSCAKKEFESASLKGIDHEHARYQFYYLIEFTPPGTPVSATKEKAEEVTEASGTGVVVWESAIVRDEPNKDGEVKARILYGARVIVQARKGEWYEVKYDGRGRTGWIHQNAIGKK